MDQQPGDDCPVRWCEFGDHVPPFGLGQVGQKIGDGMQPIGPNRPIFALLGASVGTSGGAVRPFVLIWQAFRTI